MLVAFKYVEFDLEEIAVFDIDVPFSDFKVLCKEYMADLGEAGINAHCSHKTVVALLERKFKRVIINTIEVDGDRKFFTNQI